MGTSVVYIAEYDILEGNADLQGAKRSRLHDDITATPVRLFYLIALLVQVFTVLGSYVGKTPVGTY